MDLSALPWATLGPSGLLTLVIGLIVGGRLHTDREVEAMTAVLREQIVALTEDRDYWRRTAHDLLSTTARTTHALEQTARVLDQIPHVDGGQR